MSATITVHCDARAADACELAFTIVAASTEEARRAAHEDGWYTAADYSTGRRRIVDYCAECSREANVP